MYGKENHLEVREKNVAKSRVRTSKQVDNALLMSLAPSSYDKKIHSSRTLWRKARTDEHSYECIPRTNPTACSRLPGLYRLVRPLVTGLGGPHSPSDLGGE